MFPVTDATGVAHGGPLVVGKGEFPEGLTPKPSPASDEGERSGDGALREPLAVAIAAKDLPRPPESPTTLVLREPLDEGDTNSARKGVAP